MNKSTAKKVTISDSFLEGSRISEDERLPKWKMNLCKWIGVVPMEKRQFKFRAMFKGVKTLNRGDVLIGTNGVFFAVIEVQGNRLRVVSVYGQTEVPTFRGLYYLSEDPKNVK